MTPVWDDWGELLLQCVVSGGNCYPCMWWFRKDEKVRKAGRQAGSYLGCQVPVNQAKEFSSTDRGLKWVLWKPGLWHTLVSCRM